MRIALSVDGNGKASRGLDQRSLHDCSVVDRDGGRRIIIRDLPETFSVAYRSIDRCWEHDMEELSNSSMTSPITRMLIVCVVPVGAKIMVPETLSKSAPFVAGESLGDKNAGITK